jgi:hypothetical protein
MAITDALSVCMKMLGVGADVYRGIYDSKHQKPLPVVDLPHPLDAEIQNVKVELNRLINRLVSTSEQQKFFDKLKSVKDFDAEKKLEYYKATLIELVDYDKPRIGVS